MERAVVGVGHLGIGEWSNLGYFEVGDNSLMVRLRKLRDRSFIEVNGSGVYDIYLYSLTTNSSNKGDLLMNDAFPCN